TAPGTARTFYSNVEAHSVQLSWVAIYSRPRRRVRGSISPGDSLHAWRAELHVYLALHAMRAVYRNHAYLQQVLFLLLPCHHGSTWPEPQSLCLTHRPRAEAY